MAQDKATPPKITLNVQVVYPPTTFEIEVSEKEWRDGESEMRKLLEKEAIHLFREKTFHGGESPSGDGTFLPSISVTYPLGYLADLLEEVYRRIGERK
jgi:hypothetical protein